MPHTSASDSASSAARLKALRRIARARAREPGVEARRDVAIDLRRHRHRRGADLEDDVAEHVPLERDARRHRREGARAERPEIRQRPGRAAERELLGRHEVRRPDDRAFVRRPPHRRRASPSPATRGASNIFAMPKSTSFTVNGSSFVPGRPRSWRGRCCPASDRGERCRPRAPWRARARPAR